MPASTRFQEELADCPVQQFSERCFRVVDLEDYVKEPTPSLLFDLGPKISKGGLRFSPPNDHRGLYVSATLATAGSEFAQGRKAWKGGDCGKHVSFDMSVKLTSVLDLTLASIRSALKTSKAEIMSQWKEFSTLNHGAWPPTWILGHHAYASGRFDGILFPSNRDPSGTCLLIFTERLVAGVTHVIIHRADGTHWEQLP